MSGRKPYRSVVPPAKAGRAAKTSSFGASTSNMKQSSISSFFTPRSANKSDPLPKSVPKSKSSPSTTASPSSLSLLSSSPHRDSDQPTNSTNETEPTQPKITPSKISATRNIALTPSSITSSSIAVSSTKVAPSSVESSSNMAAPSSIAASSTNIVSTKSTTPSKSAKSARSAYDEFASSEPDTSFGSPEINNFKNPLLSRSFSSTANNNNNPDRRGSCQQNAISLDDIDDEKENNASHFFNTSPTKRPSPLKRSSSSLASFPPSQTTLFRSDSSTGTKPSMSAAALLTGTALPPTKRLKSASFTASVSDSNTSNSSIKLAPEQKKVVQMVVDNGDNVFFTGSAGTGKSVVLRRLVSGLQRKYGRSVVGVTASTGLAACNIEGQTIHKFLGIGIGQGEVLRLRDKIKRDRQLTYKWKSLKVLIIDEISMIDGRLFEKLENLARLLRNSDRPFGGIQLVVTGDFFQLPPVNKDREAQYCFQSAAWNRTIKKTIVLKQVFRQQGDDQLINMLNALRYGALDEHMIHSFRQLSRRVNYTDGIEPTELYPTRAEVSRANSTRLNNLPGKPHVFRAKDNVVDMKVKHLYENMMCQEVLELKENCQVMYLKNHTDEPIVNGSIGTVVCFMPESVWGEVTTYYRGLALLDPTPEIMDELKTIARFVGGGADANPDECLSKIPPERRNAFIKLINAARREPLSRGEPIVNFKTTDGSFKLIRVTEEDFSHDGPVYMGPGDKVDKITRTQLPIILSWAMSIHKAQGQSIERLRVNLQRTFEKGQVYVALSRATSKDSLEIYNFDPRKISTSDVVKQFYSLIDKP